MEVETSLLTKQDHKKTEETEEVDKVADALILVIHKDQTLTSGGRTTDCDPRPVKRDCGSGALVRTNVSLRVSVGKVPSASRWVIIDRNNVF